jgi:hypothetical protein
MGLGLVVWARQAVLDDAEALNGRLKRQYLTVEEGSRS